MVRCESGQVCQKKNVLVVSLYVSFFFFVFFFFCDHSYIALFSAIKETHSIIIARDSE